MKQSPTKKNKKIWLKRVIVVELVVCYIALLTVVSYLRGPIRYQVVSDTPLLTARDFISFAGEGVEGEVLTIQNAEAGNAVGYSASLPLEDLELISIDFTLGCPSEYAGGVLHVDLCDPETGYDSDEQEFFLELKAGTNQVSFELNPGEHPPKSALLRFFTLDPAGYTVQNLQIYPEEAQAKVSAGMAGMVIACFVLLGGTMAVLFAVRKNES